MNKKNTIVKAVKRDGKLYRELPGGHEGLLPIPPRTTRKTETERTAAALADPDNPPASSYAPGRLKPRPRVFVIRRALKLTQEEFAEKFQVPIGTVRDWEQERVVPDQAAQAYLKLIAHDPEFVMLALTRSASAPEADELIE
jgi:putative transcriptional regulator